MLTINKRSNSFPTMPSAAPAPSVASPETNEGRGTSDSEPAIRLRIDVVYDAGDWGSQDSAVEAVNQAASALAAASELKLDQLEACVALSSDAHVARLNETYRGKLAPTNVLSFPASGEGREANFIGDVILAGETVAREAQALGIPFKNHLQHLVVHGLLHLLGFNHESDEDAQVMEAIEVCILVRLGIPNPYETSPLPHETDCAKTP